MKRPSAPTPLRPHGQTIKRPNDPTIKRPNDQTIQRPFGAGSLSVQFDRIDVEERGCAALAEEAKRAGADSVQLERCEFYLDGETLRIEGDAMSFAAGASIDFAADAGAAAGGGLVFANDVAAAGALSLSRSDGAYVAFSGTLTEIFQTIVPSGVASLADWEIETIYGLSETLSTSTATSRGRYNLVTPGGVFTSDGTQYSISLLNRWRGDRGYTYSARIQLRHQTSGSALDARINTIVHSPQNVCLPETDLWASWYTDMPAGSGLYASLSVRQNDAKGSFAGAYPAQAGIDRIVVRRVGSGAFVGFAGEAALSGPVDVALGVKLAVLPKEGSVFAAPVFSGQGDVEYRRDATLAKGNVMVYSPLLVVGDGATATVTGAAAFPTNGIVSVLNGGLLVEKAGTSMGWGGGISAGYHEIRVGRGGEVRIDKSQRGGFYNGRTEVTVDGGGTVWLGHDREHSDAAAAGWNTACTYSPYLTLSGGSRVRGPFANWGNNNGQRWTVAGGKADAAVIDAIGAVSYKQQAFTINVADVTGDAAADCVVSGEIPMFEASSANFRYYPTTKFGDGTLRIDGKWAMRGTVTVEAGAVVFGDQGGPFPAGAESALRTSVAGKREFVLKNGSALGKTAGALELDALAVTGGARLALGDGATMSFADSSAKAWTGTLVVEGFREGAVRFGTSGDGLSPEQVELIRTDAGRRVEISTSGYLVYPGFVMVVK